LLAAAALAQPLLALTITAVLVVLRSSPWAALRGAGRGPSRARGRRDDALVAVGVGAILAAPALVRLGRALSVREALAALGSPRGAEVAQFVTGLALLTLAALLAHRLAWPRPGVLAAALFAMSATILIVSVRVGPARGQLAPESVRALARLEGEKRLLQAVCAPAALVDWVPALAGRPAGGSRSDRARPWVPHVFEDEFGRSSPPPCARRLDAPAWPQ
jgi:hypothetical protein